MKNKNAQWRHCYCGCSNDDVIMHSRKGLSCYSLIVFLWNNGAVAIIFSCRSSLGIAMVDFFSPLQDWVHSVWTPHDSEEPLHQKMEQTLYKKTLLPSVKVHVLLLVCTQDSPSTCATLTSSTYVSTVESTGLHLCENEHMECALAVCVRPYPNDVLSVWLYTAFLILLSLHFHHTCISCALSDCTLHLCDIILCTFYGWLHTGYLNTVHASPV